MDEDERALWTQITAIYDVNPPYLRVEWLRRHLDALLCDARTVLPLFVSHAPTERPTAPLVWPRG